MERHAERIRRIQQLCAQLTTVIEESHRIQQTAEELHRESKALLDELEAGAVVAVRSGRASRG